MNTQHDRDGATPQAARYHFDRHRAGYREKFLDITHESHRNLPDGVDRYLRRALGSSPVATRSLSSPAARTSPMTTTCTTNVAAIRAFPFRP
jgi:hypothetical protein